MQCVIWTYLVAVCVIWTGVTNDNTCIKYLESVLWAAFKGIYTVLYMVQSQLQIRCNTYRHTGTCILSAFHFPRCNL